MRETGETSFPTFPQGSFFQRSCFDLTKLPKESATSYKLMIVSKTTRRLPTTCSVQVSYSLMVSWSHSWPRERPRYIVLPSGSSFVMGAGTLAFGILSCRVLRFHRTSAVSRQVSSAKFLNLAKIANLCPGDFSPSLPHPTPYKHNQAHNKQNKKRFRTSAALGGQDASWRVVDAGSSKIRRDGTVVAFLRATGAETNAPEFSHDLRWTHGGQD